MTKANSPTYVFRVGQLGDALVALPAIYAIKNAVGETRLIAIGDKPQRNGWVPSWDVFRLTGVFSYHLSYTPMTAPWPKGLAELAKMGLEIRKLGGRDLFLLVDPGRSNAEIKRYRRFFETVCGLNIIGLDEASAPAPPKDEAGHMPMEPPEYLRLRQIVCNYFGESNCGPMRFDLPVSGSDICKVDALFFQFGLPAADNCVAFGPGSKMPSKRWDLERFGNVGHRLVKNHKIMPIVFGGAEDAPLGEQLVRFWGTGINAAGKLSISEAACAMSRCRLYIGNDTGTMHLAAVAGLPCVAIFSARSAPGRWHPVNRGHQILRKRLPCEGCFSITCPQSKTLCLDAITVDEVFEAAAVILNRVEHDHRCA